MGQIYFDVAIRTFAGYPGYNGNPPQSEIDYASLDWRGNWNPPAWAEIQGEVLRLQADYQAKQYQRDRAAEYPSFAEQFDTLYHGGYDAWKATIDSVKAKYPKP
jgi:hypothetical protein